MQNETDGQTDRHTDSFRETGRPRGRQTEQTDRRPTQSSCQLAPATWQPWPCMQPPAHSMTAGAASRRLPLAAVAGSGRLHRSAVASGGPERNMLGTRASSRFARPLSLCVPMYSFCVPQNVTYVFRFAFQKVRLVVRDTCIKSKRV